MLVSVREGKGGFGEGWTMDAYLFPHRGIEKRGERRERREIETETNSPGLHAVKTRLLSTMSSDLSVELTKSTSIDRIYSRQKV